VRRTADPGGPSHDDDLAPTGLVALRRHDLIRWMVIIGTKVHHAAPGKSPLYIELV
jgi:hypothetical protein